MVWQARYHLTESKAVEIWHRRRNLMSTASTRSADMSMFRTKIDMCDFSRTAEAAKGSKACVTRVGSPPIGGERRRAGTRPPRWDRDSRCTVLRPVVGRPHTRRTPIRPESSPKAALALALPRGVEVFARHRAGNRPQGISQARPATAPCPVFRLPLVAEDAGRGHRTPTGLRASCGRRHD